MKEPPNVSTSDLKRHLSEHLNRIKLVFKLMFFRPDIHSGKVDYQKYWDEKRDGDAFGSISTFQKERAEWALKRIEPGSTILDIGCGDCSVLRYMASRKRITPIGADVSQAVVDKLISQGMRVQRFDLDSESPNTLPEADHILLFEVLEHTKNPEDILPLILAKARRSVFVSVPNSGYFPYRLRLLLGSFPVQWRVHPGEHLRFWTFSDFNWWLGQLGLRKGASPEVYQGIPVLNKLFRNLFGMGIIAEIRK